MYKYDPRRKSASELFETFVGKKLFEELIEDLKPVDGQLTTQHRIITGCRGGGKSHLILALYHRIKEDPILSQHWTPILFPEELYNVDSLYRLFQEVGNRWIEETEDIRKYQDLRDQWQNLLKETKSAGLTKEKRKEAVDEMMEFLNHVHEVTGKKMLLFLENLQDLLGNILSDDELKHLRAFLNESLNTLLIIGTSISVFSKVKDHGKPFYHFFQFREVPELSKEESYNFLLNYSRCRSDIEVEKLLKEIKHKVYAYHLLTGGNPRMLLFLYDYLKEEETFETESVLDSLITELTPYYKHETDKLSPQKRVVLSGLLMGPPAQTPSEIAAEVEKPLTTVVSQLNRLKKDNWIKGYPIKPGEGIKRSEEFYIIREYFYRIWYQLRTCNVCRDNIKWMAELASLLFSEEYLKEKLLHFEKDNLQVKTLYKESLNLLADDKWGKSLKRIQVYATKTEQKKIEKLLKEIEDSLHKKDLKKAERFCKELTTFPEVLDVASLVFGLIKHFQGDMNAAIEAYLKAVEIKPDKHEAWYNMGNAYSDKEEYDKAIEAYSKAVEIKPDKHEAWYNMGSVYSDKQEYDKAIEAYSKAVKIKPDKHEAWYNMGNVYTIGKQEYDRAIEAYSKAVEIKPDKHEAWYNMGNAYSDKQEYDKAIEAYSKAVKIKPDKHEAWNNLGNAYDNKQEYNKAINAYSKAVEIKPDKHGTWFNMGRVYTNKKNYKGALDSLKRYIEYTPSFEPHGYAFFKKLSDLYRKIGNAAKVVQNALHPDSSLEDRTDSVANLLLMGKTDMLNETVDLLLNQGVEISEELLKRLNFFILFSLIDAFKDEQNLKAIETLSEVFGKLIETLPEERAKEQIYQFLICSSRIHEGETLGILKRVFNLWEEAGLDIPDVVFEVIKAVQNPESREARKWAPDPMFAEITKLLRGVKSP